MNAIGYARCSTHEQADSGLGMIAQAERIRAYCSLKDLALVDIISDAGVSGSKPLARRHGGQQLLEAVGRKAATAIVMLKLDRMFRNAHDCLGTVENARLRFTPLRPSFTGFSANWASSSNWQKPSGHGQPTRGKLCQP